VGGTHDLVVLPALAIGVFPLAVFIDHRAMAIGKGGFHLAKEIQSVQKVAHLASEFLPPDAVSRPSRADIAYPAKITAGQQQRPFATGGKQTTQSEEAC
jgi:hypothetical protein